MNKKELEDYLNETTYEFEDYKPSKEAIEFINFIKLVNGGSEENKSPVVHFKVLDNIFNSKKRHAIVCHRGFAKTSLMAEYLFMYIAVFGEIPEFGEVSLALYVADSAEGGAKNLRKNIESRYENSEFMKEWVPSIKFTDNRLQFINKSGKKLVVKMYGAKTNIRGTKEMGIRPQLVVMDDLLSDQDAKSPTELENVKNNVHNAIGKALSPKRSKTIYIGTPFNKNDPLVEVVESGKWNVSVYPICEEYPCEEENFKGSWEDRFPFDYVEDEYEASASVGRINSFNQELMLRILSKEDMVIQDDDIVWFDRSTVLQNKNNYNFYITTDFATSDKLKADFSVVGIWAINEKGHFMLVDGYAKRQLMDKNIDMLFKYVSMYKPMGVGIEITGQQGGFISWIKNEMIDRNIYFNLLSESGSTKEGIRPTTNKFKRFMDVVPLFKSKRIWFASALKDTDFMKEGLNELSNVSNSGFKSKHDDFLDIISMLITFEPVRPNSPVEYSYNDETDEFEEIDYYSDEDDNNSYDF